jgi:hypothetical protein
MIPNDADRNEGRVRGNTFIECLRQSWICHEVKTLVLMITRVNVVTEFRFGLKEEPDSTIIKLSVMLWFLYSLCLLIQTNNFTIFLIYDST